MKCADQVALEAGNSAAIVKHFRELATEEQAGKWIGILPKPGQVANTFEWDRRAGVTEGPYNPHANGACPCLTTTRITVALSVDPSSWHPLHYGSISF